MVYIYIYIYIYIYLFILYAAGPKLYHYSSVFGQVFQFCEWPTFFFFFLVCVWRMWETNKHTHTNFRVRLFWVKMISGNHFHHFPHVWLSRKISFSGKWLPVYQYFHLWPENHFLPSFSLQITSGKREREKERERRESPDQREREREERAQIAPLVRRSYRAYERRDRRDRAARSMRSRGAIVDRAARSTSALVGRAPLVGAIVDRRRDGRIGCISFAGFWFLLPDLMHFL